MSKKEGLKPNKYIVQREDGKELKGGGCIVLEFGDKNARGTLLFWADHMNEQGYKELYSDLVRKLAETPVS